MKWADKHRTLKVRTNADTPDDAQRARDFGAEGIGLCRTEHMFFEGDRIEAMREMILARHRRSRGQGARRSCCRSSATTSIGIFTAMEGLPVTIRLLDPPLHEFLPHDDKRAGGDWRSSWAFARRRCSRARRRSCTRPTRCSATAAAACAITYPEILEHAGAGDRRGGHRVLADDDRARARDHASRWSGTEKELAHLRQVTEEIIAEGA
jgi:pyruvate,orthophosphate dikinase